MSRAEATTMPAGDPLASFDATERATLGAVAGTLIPAAHGMPSAAEILTDERLRFVLRARPDLVEPLRAALRPDLGDDVRGRLDALGRDEPAVLAAMQLVIVAGYYTDTRVRELHRLPRTGRDRDPLVGIPGVSRGRSDRRRARTRAGMARPGDRAAGRGRRGAEDLRRTLVDRRRVDGRRRVDRRRDLMAAIAPDTTESAAPGWLGSFVETWEPGTGAPVEDREPATGRLIATVRGSTPDDVARAAAAARAAQPAWAETSYQERARILRRAAEIYEANRAEFGVWTMRETGASHSKMHHESNFAYGEIQAAATLPWQPYGSARPDGRPGSALDDPARSRSGWSGRSPRGTPRASSACASWPRPSPSATPWS